MPSKENRVLYYTKYIIFIITLSLPLSNFLIRTGNLYQETCQYIFCRISKPVCDAKVAHATQNCKDSDWLKTVVTTAFALVIATKSWSYWGSNCTHSFLHTASLTAQLQTKEYFATNKPLLYTYYLY